MREVVVLLGAEIEMQSAYERCFRWENAEQLETHVQAALVQLARHPFSGRPYFGRFRRLVVRRSNYGLFHVVDPSRILVHAMWDLRSDPEAIRRRLVF